MRKALLVLFIFSFSVGNSQEKHQGLLWEITGNGLKKTSYLYGTMHVSGRIAYHLGEEFFEGLNSVDAIALESNPIIWLDEIVESRFADSYLGNYAIKYQTYKGFYKEGFKIKPPKNKDFGQALSANHYLANWMLYRENARNKEFEEDTFLDMFIYQAGSKNNKPVYSLEDFKQTSVFSMKSRIPDIKRKERSEWYKKKTKDKRYYDILQDAYRDQDLDLLDSLQSEVSSDNHLKYMLVDRNIIMANNIDSIIQSNTSLFIGIGAAHLPKSKGVIGLLRAKGYTVKPAKLTFSEKAKAEKEKLSKQKRVIPLANEFKTEMFTMKVPGGIYETPTYSNQRQFFSPELTNGTFYTVKQLSTFNFFKGINKDNYLAKIDSLLFENIPGKIQSKKEIVKDGYKGLDIVNKTKTGDYQRYQIIFTPINVLIFKMGGKNDFVQKEGDKFFKNVRLITQGKSWKMVSTIKKDFKVKVPEYYHMRNNTKATSLYGHPEIEAYEESTDNYYFFKRATLYDNYFIEEDEFELKRIADKFCKELKIDSVDKFIEKGAKYSTVLAYARTADSSYLSLKIVIKGANYYLLANVSPMYSKSNDFFDSFELQNFNYTFGFEQKTDSILKFKVNSNFLLPNPYKQMVEQGYDRRRERKETEDKTFLRKREKETYISENFERIHVEYVKFHMYKQILHIDSLWDEEIRDFEKEESVFLKNRIQSEKNGIHTLDVVFMDTNSSRTIEKKYIMNGGSVYVLTANLDSLSKRSKFVNEFFTTFTPNDTAKHISVFGDKPTMFFEALEKGDSLAKERALQSVSGYVKFKEKDSKNLMKYISNYGFPTKHIEAKEQMIKDLGKLENSKILPFLTNLYSQMEDTAMYQLAILKALSKQKNKKASETFIKLLDKDIPLASSKWAINSLFNVYRDSMDLAKDVFPELLDFTFVQDYRKPVYRLLTVIVDSNKIKPKKYKKYYKQILREAKIELKSQISGEQSAAADEENNSYYYSSYKNQGNQLLVNYTTLLIPFYNKSDVKEYFEKLKRVKDYKVQTQVNCKLVKNGIKVEGEVWNHLAEDIINNAYLYKKLKKINQLDLFPSEFKSQILSCKSILYERNFNFKKDSLKFIKKEKVTVEGEEGYVYFFKTKKEKADNWKMDYIGLQPLDSTKINVNTAFENKGISILKGKDIDELIEEKLKEIRIKGHPRADEREDRGGYW